MRSLLLVLLLCPSLYDGENAPPLEGAELAHQLMRRNAPTVCRADEEYQECGCPRTCCNRAERNHCGANCYPGCFCRGSTVRDNDWRCVEPALCDKSCGANEEMKDCAKPAWCNTCASRGDCGRAQCRRGCDCRAGHLRDGRGVCVPADQCPASCPMNEVQSECVNPCNLCTIPEDCSSPQQCRRGCECREGYVRLRMEGTCVPLSSCPAVTESIPECSRAICNQGCQMDYSTKPCPTCRCAVGRKAPTEDIGVQTRQQCESLHCPADCSVNYNAVPCPQCYCPNTNVRAYSVPTANNNHGGNNNAGSNNGPNYNINPGQFNNQRTNSNQRPFNVSPVGNEPSNNNQPGYGNPPNNQPSNVNQRPFANANPANNQPSNNNQRPYAMPIPSNIQPSNSNQRPNVNSNNNQRPNSNMNPNSNQPSNNNQWPNANAYPNNNQPSNNNQRPNAYPNNNQPSNNNQRPYGNTNPSANQPTNGNQRPYNDPGSNNNPAPNNQPAYNNEGSNNDQDSTSIIQEDCLVEGEVFVECASACPLTCENYGRSFACTQQCVSGCFCREDLVRSVDGSCIRPSQCPQVPNICGLNEHWVSCVKTRSCNSCARKGNCSPSRCMEGCDCLTGHYRNNSGICVPENQCSAYAPDTLTPQCRPDEQYYDCKPTCQNDCETYGSNVVCPRYCIAGCDCAEGTVRRSDGQCVPPSQCRPIKDTGEGTTVAAVGYGATVRPAPNPGRDELRKKIKEKNRKCELERVETGAAFKCTMSIRRTVCEVWCKLQSLGSFACEDSDNGPLWTPNLPNCVKPKDAAEVMTIAPVATDTTLRPSSPVNRQELTKRIEEKNQKCKLERVEAGSAFKCTMSIRGTVCEVWCDFQSLGTFACGSSDRGPLWTPTLPSCVKPKDAEDATTIVPVTLGATIKPSHSPDRDEQKKKIKDKNNKCELERVDAGAAYKCTMSIRGTVCEVWCNYQSHGRFDCGNTESGPLWMPNLPSCVKPKASTDDTRQCKVDERFYQCIPCQRTCEIYANPSAACTQACTSGCFCKDGLVKRNDGKCVPLSQCTVPDINNRGSAAPTNDNAKSNPRTTAKAEGEKRTEKPCQLEMVKPGKANCTITNQLTACDIHCSERFMGRHTCDHSRQQWTKNLPQCVKPIDHTKSVCGPDEEHYECSPSCKNTCTRYRDPAVRCNCQPRGCFCRQGLVKRETDNKCVPPSQCPADPRGNQALRVNIRLSKMMKDPEAEEVNDEKDNADVTEALEHDESHKERDE